MKISKLKSFMGVLALLAVGSVPMAAQSKTPTAQEKKNLKLVQDWWREVITFHHVELAPKYAAEDMIQHNPNFPSGLDPLRKAFGSSPVNPMPAALPKERTPVVQFAKGDYVVMVFEHEDKDPVDAAKTYKWNSFDAFRLEGGKIKEHWDGATKNASGANVSYNPSVAGSTGKLSAEEKKNQDTAIVEMKDILQYGHLELADKAMATGYIQHNPNVPGGREGFKTFFARFAKPEPIKPEWKRPPVAILTSGDIAFFLVENEGKEPADPSKTYKYNWFDMLRIENGMIAEHWDTAKKNPPAPAGGKKQ